MAKKKSNKGQLRRNQPTNRDESDTTSVGLMRDSFGAQLIGMSFDAKLPSEPTKKANDGVASVTQLLKNYQSGADDSADTGPASSVESVESNASNETRPIVDIIQMDQMDFSMQSKAEPKLATEPPQHSAEFIEPAFENNETTPQDQEQDTHPQPVTAQKLASELVAKPKPSFPANSVIPVSDEPFQQAKLIEKSHEVAESSLPLETSSMVPAKSELDLVSLMLERGLPLSDISRLLSQLLREDSELVQDVLIKESSKLHQFLQSQLMFVGEHLSAMVCHQINQRYLVHTTPSRCELSGGLDADDVARDLLTRLLERGIRFVAFCNVPSELHGLLRHLLLHHALRVKCFQAQNFSSSAVVPSSELQLVAIWKSLGNRRLYVRSDHDAENAVVQHLLDSTNVEFVGAIDSPTIITFLQALSKELEQL